MKAAILFRGATEILALASQVLIHTLATPSRPSDNHSQVREDQKLENMPCKPFAHEELRALGFAGIHLREWDFQLQGLSFRYSPLISPRQKSLQEATFVCIKSPGSAAWDYDFNLRLVQVHA